MSKDPAFLFYPGDYLRDTQCLNEVQQVAYDRIMCEHMRNICIRQSQLKFFTKKLSEEELEELKMILTENEDGFQITWVAESIAKRRKYSESRRKNRKGKNKEHMLSHDTHMENEIENVIVNSKIDKRKRGVGKNQSRKNPYSDNLLSMPEIENLLRNESQTALENLYRELKAMSWMKSKQHDFSIMQHFIEAFMLHIGGIGERYTIVGARQHFRSWCKKLNQIPATIEIKPKKIEVDYSKGFQR